LHLLQRIAEQLTVSLHPRIGRVTGCVARLPLNQHRQHMDGKGMPELVWADLHWKPGIGAAAACPSELILSSEESKHHTASFF